ncbi:hypothetical protein LZC95_29615 [Pendulispora brunnea]|uniref:DNA topoisomerase (ATP-hydrolyzing) n=1 Tax=Pendulispora brunnea TaxID=2905690 RepID=A0ABZ2JVV4_9BACT
MEDIEVLYAVACIRKRPGMYVLDVHDRSGLHWLARMLFEEFIEEHRRERCFRLEVTIHASGALTLESDGNVLPLHGRKCAEVLLTTIGCAPSWDMSFVCANALAESLFVEIRQGGRCYTQSYRRGQAQTPMMCIGATEKTGVRLTLRPDPEIFDNPQFDGHLVSRMMGEQAFLNPGLHFIFYDERSGRRETFHGRGLAEWVTRLTEGQSAFPKEPLVFRHAHPGKSLQAALLWTRHRTPRLRGFVNLRPVPEGAHVEGLVEGLAQALHRARLARYGYRAPWAAERLKEGLVGIIEMRGDALEVGGSCRERLEGAETKATIRQFVCEAFTEQLSRHEELCVELCKLTELSASRD